MQLLLILRSETACLVMLTFLAFMSRAYKVKGQDRTFTRLLWFAIVHVIFDIVTVITVNNTQTVPYWANWICHFFFYMSAIFYSNEIINYAVGLCYPKFRKTAYKIGHILAVIYILCLPFLKMEFVQGKGSFSSTGPAAYVGYALAFSYFILALVLIFTHWKTIPDPVKSALIPMMVVLICTEAAQVIWREVLFTGGAITIVTVGFFFSLENPVAVFKRMAMTDALTGVRSRSSYEVDIEKLSREFKAHPTTDFIFVFCDIKDLRMVNNTYGHDEGDRYISLIATAIRENLKSNESVYRIGGDEFLVMYRRVPEETVVSEIIALEKACIRANEELEYVVSVSCGYAQSSSNYATLKDVVNTADYAMYQNKAKFAQSHTYDNSALGTKINYAGLTDKMFEAMCSADVQSYPFITNMSTNVTRISKDWKEFFGLDAEFYSDFVSTWIERVDPADREGYTQDLIATINGRQKFHHYVYHAKRANGDYVRITCRGSVYYDTSTDTNFFVGSILNHDLEEKNDAVTGLRNFDAITNTILQRMERGEPFSILKFKLNKFARVNMFYGYEEGNKVIRGIVKVMRDAVGDKGEVFCQNSVNLSIVFNSCDREFVRDFYKQICNRCAQGIECDRGVVSVLFSGGALLNNGEKMYYGDIRAQLVFAVEESQYYRHSELVFCDEVISSESEADRKLLGLIHSDALSGMRYFTLHMQPIVDAQTGKIVSAEALLRWIHPEYGYVSPSRFINFLENDPCYYRVGKAILRNALQYTVPIRKVLPDFKVNVNITALQLQDEFFVEEVVQILRETDCPPQNLVLELTERCKEMEGDFLTERINALREKGILIAFDDLGTGYSTINLLMNTPVDEVKLDKDFVMELGSREDYQLFAKVLSLGGKSENHNYIMCFEGIENEEMLSLVRSYGPVLAQGYYFSKPLTPEELLRYVEKEAQA